MIKKLSNKQGTAAHTLGELRELVREYRNKLNEVIDVINERTPAKRVTRSACCDAEVVMHQHSREGYYAQETMCSKCKYHCALIHRSI